MDAERFEAHRPLLRAVAGRVLGSTAEADDAVQETWLRFTKADSIDNLESWLRTCSDTLQNILAVRDALTAPIKRELRFIRLLRRRS